MVAFIPGVLVVATFTPAALFELLTPLN